MGLPQIPEDRRSLAEDEDEKPQPGNSLPDASGAALVCCPLSLSSTYASEYNWSMCVPLIAGCTAPQGSKTADFNVDAPVPINVQLVQFGDYQLNTDGADYKVGRLRSLPTLRAAHIAIR